MMQLYDGAKRGLAGELEILRRKSRKGEGRGNDNEREENEEGKEEEEIEMIVMKRA